MSISYNKDKTDNYEEIKNYDISTYNRYNEIVNKEIPE